MGHGSEAAAGGPPLAVVAASEEVLALPEADERLLDRVERDRAALFRRERDRTDFVAAHLLVRLCAARLLGIEPAEVAFGQLCPGCGQRGHGRPLLTDRPGVHLSLSHSAGMVAAAAGPVPVGVDVERPAATTAGVEQRVLAPAEAELVRRHPDPAAAFLRLWVRKEALIKIGRVDLDTLAQVDLSALPLLPAEDGPLSHRFGDLHLLDWTDRRRGVLVGAASTAPVRLGTAAVPLTDLG
ncbi:4'-phosphopantetheinyl transferase family protein [Kitasatospora terrestris]|uniref:4'-phosphopantetheinyl transferase domain-containing protein n=1 Tax=Kitasatospora terrestris TaxID=258051 RepID=A0ABP9DHY9_9ACTN